MDQETGGQQSFKMTCCSLVLLISAEVAKQSIFGHSFGSGVTHALYYLEHPDDIYFESTYRVNLFPSLNYKAGMDCY